MAKDHLTDRLGSEPILSVSVNLTVTETETVRVNGPEHRTTMSSLFFFCLKS